MRGSCVLQVLQGPPRRAEGKGVKRSDHRERSSQSLATPPKQKSPAICAKRPHEADFCLRSSQSLATQPLLNAHNLKKITNFDHQTTNKQMRQTNNYEIAVSSVADVATIAQIRLYADRNNISAHKVYEKVGMEQCHYLMYEQSIK